jgi:hypothetical protein
MIVLSIILIACDLRRGLRASIKLESHGPNRRLKSPWQHAATHGPLEDPARGLRILTTFEPNPGGFPSVIPGFDLHGFTPREDSSEKGP